MHPFYSAAELRFRDELRDFFRREIPERIRAKVSAGQPLEKADLVESQRILNAHGLAVPHWPKEWGGRDWTPVQRAIFTEELQRTAVPLPLQFNCYMVGPVIAAFGSQAQKERFLPRAANLDDWWCQGFSEPDAGSDLASLKTKAVRTADGYLVSGQKIWTTYAQYADWIFCLVRTDPAAKKQAGISFLLIDMASPGVTVRPIITMDGRHEVNEVFLDNVLVPFENLVGEENKGWDYAKYLLANERAGIARIGLSKERIARVRRLARQTRAGDRPLWDLETFRARVLQVEVELKALEFTQMRVLAESDHGSHAPNPMSSILKLKGSQLQQAASELMMEVAGAEGFSPASADYETVSSAVAFETYLNFRKVSIYGGSNEIQRNIIAKTILNL
ncbi:Acyl-CoA dehydrogenase [Xaviernesmea oryzae]|uniref:Acyl-CoA dehydrogenase n=1 Tax=Xaviernesmea oryzae TaxID=464029 RepID=A0A1X7FRB8_9HYPH|nr:acyl-CoA dehydrogenase family protein [Xaviernesmea oryzae]SMF56615.1 Acyl-CoA dehydrogenase [Xaviernesmea oryzae]